MGRSGSSGMTISGYRSLPSTSVAFSKAAVSLFWIGRYAVCVILITALRGGTDMTTKLERLLEKEAQLKAQIQQAKAAERTLEKKRDTRRKILVGAAVMARVESGRWPKEDLLEMMDGFLSRPNERELFGLSGGDESAVEQPVEEQAALGKGRSAKPIKKVAKKQTASVGSGKAEKGAGGRLAEPDFDVEKEFNL